MHFSPVVFIALSVLGVTAAPAPAELHGYEARGIFEVMHKLGLRSDTQESRQKEYDECVEAAKKDRKVKLEKPVADETEINTEYLLYLALCDKIWTALQDQ
ncbi:Uu.00g115610.m01.CDS01 [Anthostomella pinea]|uniref:Uu.00g115610.m01.CDS01 n=1 Tax=Anthostomella pinea TaxID=933095 RepID=A0AAI8VFX9_9PEZI|nr:Uu.00g115610.m01.CDS01 [Anthostomella pinea]